MESKYSCYEFGAGETQDLASDCFMCWCIAEVVEVFFCFIHNMLMVYALFYNKFRCNYINIKLVTIILSL